MSDITITRWTSLTNPHGLRRRVTWEQLYEMLSRPKIIGLAPSKKKERKGKLDPDKSSLDGWSAATFADDVRRKDACESISAAVIDYDGGASLAQAIELWRPYKGFVHTSPSHQFEDYGDRFRVILRISRPVTPEEYPRLWAWVKAKCDAAGHVIDEAPKDPSRLWFMPGKLVDAPFEAFDLKGEVLDVDKVLAEVPAKTKRTAAPRAAKQAATTTTVTPPSRHTALLHKAVKLRQFGAEPEHVQAAVHEMNAAFDEPKPEAEVDKIANWSERIPEGYNDHRHANEIVKDHGNVLRSCYESGWMYYAIGRWTRDPKTPVKLAKATMRRLAMEAVRDEEDPKLITKLLKHGTVLAALALADPDLAIRIDKFDADHWLFNCLNGTLDLRTGELREHRASDYITKMAGVAFDKNAKCPKWLAHLEKVLPDAEVRGYLQRLVGYSMTGVIREHVLPIHWGDGGNGKGSTFNTLLHIWGDYGTTVAAEMLLERNGHEEHQTEKAQLLGARLVVASETAKGRRLNESLIKHLTGGDPIKARFMHKDYFLFYPTFKLQLLTNYKPGVRGTDTGIWRRVKLTPWNIVLAESDQKTDFEESLLEEWAGILNWALEGCLAWQKTGLAPPAAVAEATQVFRLESDVLGRFIAECCDVSKLKTVGATDLFNTYEHWCKAAEELPMKQKAFGTDLAKRVPSMSKQPTRVGVIYHGIGLRLEPTDEPDGSHGSQGRSDSQPNQAAVKDVKDVNDSHVNYPRTRMQDHYPNNGSHGSHGSQGDTGDFGRFTVYCEDCGAPVDHLGVCTECHAQGEMPV